VQCVNRKLGRLVERLIGGPRRVIVVLQSDHGYGRFGRYLPALTDAAPEQVAERADLFAAYHLPGRRQESFTIPSAR
jgi:hypothetical protein